MPTFVILKGTSSNKQEAEKKEEVKKGKIVSKDICYFPIKGRVVLLNPFIDKISITYKIADKELELAVVEALKIEAEEKTAVKSHPTATPLSRPRVTPYGRANVSLLMKPRPAARSLT